MKHAHTWLLVAALLALLAPSALLAEDGTGFSSSVEVGAAGMSVDDEVNKVNEYSSIRDDDGVNPYIRANLNGSHGGTHLDLEAIEAANAVDTEQVIVMSIDPSAWRAEHYFAVTRDVPGQEMVRLSGNYMTKVFEGPYKNAPQWEKEMQAYVRSKGKQPGKVYFFYTTCPKCAKAYGKNYVIGIAEVMPGE